MKTKKQLEETKEFNLLVPFSVKDMGSDEDGETLNIEGYGNYAGDCSGDMSCCAVDLSGEIVVPDGMDLSIYKQNPQILWQHNRHYSCGKATKVQKKKDGIYIYATIHKGAMEEDDWYRVKNGLVTRFSIGFRVLSGEFKEINKALVYFITKSQLLETSIVTIPCSTESAFTIVKSYEGEGFYAGELGEKISPSTENKNQNQEEEDTEMKVKFRDTLSAEDVAKLESLGLQEKLDETVDVDIKQFIAAIVKAELKMIEDAKVEAENKEAEKLAAEAKEKEFESLAEELGITVEEAKALTEDEIKEKRQAIEDAKNEDNEVTEELKSLLAKLDETTKELTVE